MGFAEKHNKNSTWYRKRHPEEEIKMPKVLADIKLPEVKPKKRGVIKKLFRLK